MSPASHLKLLAQMVGAWFLFWVLGQPAYYQQYDARLIGAASIVLQVLLSLWALTTLERLRPELRRRRAVVLSLYCTVPFATLDALYCGAWLGEGPGYLVKYWYLTIFYVTPWLTFLPTEWALRQRPVTE